MVGNQESERERGRKPREKKSERVVARARETAQQRGETHVRATTIYFGAALHTPRGGQCPSLLRPKEEAGERPRRGGEPERGAEPGEERQRASTERKK